MAYGLSNDHMTDDVTWPWKVKLVTPISLRAQYLENYLSYRDFKFGTQISIWNA